VSEQALPQAYGPRSLPALLTSVLHALGVDGDPGDPSAAGRLPVLEEVASRPVRRACVVLVDGLGWQLLREHADAAPFLSSLLPEAATHGPLTAGFPTTTASSLAALGTGLPTGGHGVAGLEVAVPGSDVVMSSLSWRGGPPPHLWQPHPTGFERAAAAGVAVARVGPRGFDGCGLTEAALRGGRYLAAESPGERVAATAQALRQRDRALVYVYYGDLDATGHRAGCASTAWERQLAHVDLFVRQLAHALPRDAALWVTADHGMLDVPASRRVDLADEPALLDGVRAVAGEARARYLHTVDGAAHDVAARWRARFGDDLWVLPRDAAVDAGWFGRVHEHVRPRIGDVVAVARSDLAVVDSRREPPEVLQLVGMHGALTDAERWVPLLGVSS
jgi:hypothetical protein